MRFSFFAVSVLTILSLGCSPKPVPPVVQNTPAPPAPVTSSDKGSPFSNMLNAVQEAQKAAEAKTAPVVPPAAPPTIPPAAAPPAAPPPATSAPNSEQVVAKQGVGIKGRSLDEYEGVVVTPVKSLFAARERVVFDIQIPQALQLYKANDPQGAGPKTHEQFMAEVIAANNIKLPQLPDKHRYLYDPKTEQLMVERPKSVPPAN